MMSLLILYGCVPIAPTPIPPPAGTPVTALSGRIPSSADPRNPRMFSDFARFAASRFWGNGRFDDDRAGTGGNTGLMIEALPDGHNYAPTTAAVLVARIINRGPHPDQVYGTSPNPNFVYYVVAQRDELDATRVAWRMYRVNLRTEAVALHRSGSVWRCHYGNPSNPTGLSGRASFLRFEMGSGCTPRPASGGGSGRTIRFEAPIPSTLTNTDSGWFACDGNGCCVFDNTANAY
jgi:hypothetical protein